MKEVDVGGESLEATDFSRRIVEGLFNKVII